MGLLDREKEFHLDITKGDVGEYVILAGDPGRIPKIAEHFDSPSFVAENREYVTWTGYLEGVKISAVSTGIGGPSAAIAEEELIHCGAHTFIRVGTSGGMKDEVRGGDLVIATAATRSEGTSHEYIPDDYPAVADFEVISALKEAAEPLSDLTEMGKKYHVGVIHSKDSFYGETNPETMPVEPMLRYKWDSFIKCGCLTSEMEAAALFSVGIARGVRVGCVLTALWNAERHAKGLPDTVCHSSERAIKCAVEAMRILIKKEKGK